MPNLKSVRPLLPPSHAHVKKISINVHNVECRFVIGPSDIPFVGMCEHFSAQKCLQGGAVKGINLGGRGGGAFCFISASLVDRTFKSLDKVLVMQSCSLPATKCICCSASFKIFVIVLLGLNLIT